MCSLLLGLYLALKLIYRQGLNGNVPWQQSGICGQSCLSVLPFPSVEVRTGDAGGDWSELSDTEYLVPCLFSTRINLAHALAQAFNADL